MLRSRLKNKYLKNRNETNKRNYKKQRKYVSLLKKTKQKYYENLDEKKITDSKLIQIYQRKY